MITEVLVSFVVLFARIFSFLLVVRVLMSYFVSPENRLYAGVVSLTEPLLAPVRKVLPATPGIDWAPMATFFILQGLVYLVSMLLVG